MRASVYLMDDCWVGPVSVKILHVLTEGHQDLLGSIGIYIVLNLQLSLIQCALGEIFTSHITLDT